MDLVSIRMITDDLERAVRLYEQVTGVAGVRGDPGDRPDGECAHRLGAECPGDRDAGDIPSPTASLAVECGYSWRAGRIQVALHPLIGASVDDIAGRNIHP